MHALRQKTAQQLQQCEDLYAHISEIHTVLQNGRDTKKECPIPNSYSHRPTLQTRFRLSGGFCKRTEVQRRQTEPAPGVSADRAQTSLKIKKPLRGKYFWCLHTVSDA